MMDGNRIKQMVVKIHSVVPDDPVDAVSVMALALAFCAVGAGFKRPHLEAAIDKAFAKAEEEANRQNWTA